MRTAMLRPRRADLQPRSWGYSRVPGGTHEYPRVPPEPRRWEEIVPDRTCHDELMQVRVSPAREYS